MLFRNLLETPNACIKIFIYGLGGERRAVEMFFLPLPLSSSSLPVLLSSRLTDIGQDGIPSIRESLLQSTREATWTHWWRSWRLEGAKVGVDDGKREGGGGAQLCDRKWRCRLRLTPLSVVTTLLCHFEPDGGGNEARDGQGREIGSLTELRQWCR